MHTEFNEIKSRILKAQHDSALAAWREKTEALVAAARTGFDPDEHNAPAVLALSTPEA